jgi:hypothetical protein
VEAGSSVEIVVTIGATVYVITEKQDPRNKKKNKADILYFL